MAVRARVVIVGSGFGGLNAAQKLKKADVDIKLIARTTHHLFQPLLYQVATGIISEGEIAPPTRLILRKQENAQVLLGDVTHVDLDAQTVTSELLGHDYTTPQESATDTFQITDTATWARGAGSATWFQGYALSPPDQVRPQSAGDCQVGPSKNFSL